MGPAAGVDRLRDRRVLVVGDVMVDEFLRGEVSRISPEAPVPVLEVRERESRLGGAANAAANIQALGGRATLVGVVGADREATVVGGRLAELGITAELVADPDRPTTKKTRLAALGDLDGPKTALTATLDPVTLTWLWITGGHRRSLLQATECALALGLCFPDAVELLEASDGRRGFTRDTLETTLRRWRSGAPAPATSPSASPGA